jgi:hypothetical protein
LARRRKKINEKGSFMMRNKDVAFPMKPTHTNYDEDIRKAEIARNNQLRDTDPMIEKEGFLAVDDLDRLRRRNVKHITK